MVKDLIDGPYDDSFDGSDILIGMDVLNMEDDLKKGFIDLFKRASSGAKIKAIDHFYMHIDIPGGWVNIASTVIGDQFTVSAGYCGDHNNPPETDVDIHGFREFVDKVVYFDPSQVQDMTIQDFMDNVLLDPLTDEMRDCTRDIDD